MSTNQLNADAWNIRALIRNAEAITDGGLAACTELKLAMLRGRRNEELEVGTGQEALLRLQRAEGHFASAFNELLRVHDQLSQIAREHAAIDDGVPTEPKGIVQDDATVVELPRAA